MFRAHQGNSQIRNKAAFWLRIDFVRLSTGKMAAHRSQDLQHPVEGIGTASNQAAPFVQKNPIRGHACKPLDLKFFAALHTCRTCDTAA
jgi:hypothetical protein